MIAPIYINGIIGGDGNIGLMEVISQVHKYPEATEYRVFIDSPGGYCDMGYAIYDYLISLKGKKITTIANGMVASIATVIFLAGEERLVSPNSRLMIHNPWGDEIKGDADQLELAAMEMRAEEDKLIRFYSKITGISSQGLDALMKQETYMSPEQAIEMKFATGITQPIKAVAKIKNNFMNIGEKMDFLISLLSGKKHMNMTLTSADGKVLTVEYPDGIEDGIIETGDMVSIDGKPASGDIVMPDGSTVKVEAGKVTEVMPAPTAQADPVPAPELATALERITALEAELESAKNENTVVAEKFALLEKAIEKSKSFTAPAGINFVKKVADEKPNAFAKAMEIRNSTKK